MSQRNGAMADDPIRWDASELSRWIWNNSSASQCLPAQRIAGRSVKNFPGAGSTLAGKIAAGAEPDGYTLLLGSAATLAIGPTLLGSPP